MRKWMKRARRALQDHGPAPLRVWVGRCRTLALHLRLRERKRRKFWRSDRFLRQITAAIEHAYAPNVASLVSPNNALLRRLRV